MNMEGLFINPTTFLVSKEMFTHKLWISYGFETLELQSFAIKFLSQVIVTSTCERNWSTFEFIYTQQKNNRLTFKRAANLIFVFISLHLRKKNDLIYKEKIVEWTYEDE